MITAVTLNAAMDRTMLVPNFLIGRRHRATSGTAMPGGRGIVMARAMHQLGYPVICTGFAGGLNGTNIVDRLTAEGLLNDFVRIKQPSRTSTAVIDPVTNVLTEINEHGPDVDEHEISLLFDKIAYLSRASRGMVFAGTLPGDTEANIYQRMIRSLADSDVLTTLLCPDDPLVLTEALSAEPDIVIVTAREAEAIVGHEFDVDDDYHDAIEELGSLGARTAILLHATGCAARVRFGRAVTYYEARHEPIASLSQLGVPESFAAGLLYQRLRGRADEEQIHFAMATALADAQTMMAGSFERTNIDSYLTDVEVTSAEHAVD